MPNHAHEPTEQSRRTVRAMAGFGIPEEQISKAVGISPHTLRKHYRHDLDVAHVEATAKVAQSLFRMATEGGNVAAAIFWMKARAGWREKQVHEVTGAADGPVKVEHSGEMSVRALLAEIDGKTRGLPSER